MIKFFKNIWFKNISLKRYIKYAETFGDMVSYSHLGEPVGFNEVKQTIENYNILLLSKNIRPYTLQELNESGWSGKHLSPNLPVISNPEEIKMFLQLWYDDELELQRILSLELLKKIL